MFIFGNYNVLQTISFIIGSFAVALIVNMLAVFIAREFLIVDNPDGDKLKIHKKITPLSGGIGLFLIIAIALIILLPTQMTFIIWVLVIFILGLLDDKYRVKPLVRLLVHSTLAATLYLFLFHLQTSGVFMLIISILIFVGTIVAINMIDGMDGICISLSLVTACGFLFISFNQQIPFTTLLSFGITMFSIVFLLFNFKPAKAFLGSTGSELLGFLFAFLALFISTGNILRFIILIAIVGIPIFDLLRVMLIRFLNKKPLMAGDRNHIFDWMKSRGLGQIQIWGILFATQIILVAIFTGIYLKTV